MCFIQTTASLTVATKAFALSALPPTGLAIKEELGTITKQVHFSVTFSHSFLSLFSFTFVLPRSLFLLSHLRGNREQLGTSLASMKKDCADIFYLHMPDAEKPLEDILAEVNDLHKAGKFIEFGISNFPAWQVVEIFAHCAAHGYVSPSVYQVFTQQFRAFAFVP